MGNKSIEYKQEVLNSSNGEGASTFLKSCDSKETKDILSKSKAVINRIKYYEEIIKGVEDTATVREKSIKESELIMGYFFLKERSVLY